MKNRSQILSSMKVTLDSFVAQLSLSKSAPTVEAYRYDVARFLEYLLGRNVKGISAIKPVHIIDYLGACKEQGKSDASINRYYMSIKSYLDFCDVLKW